MRRVTIISMIISGLFASVLSRPVFAERADKMKPMTIEADHFVHDEARRISNFRGNVILVKGTLQIRADELEVIEDKAGYQSATALGKPVQFKQKREAVNEMIEGESRKLFYSAREETVRLQDAAEMRRVIEGKPADVMQGELIVYDSLKERYEVSRSGGTANLSPQTTNPSGRVRVVIQPKPESKQP